MRHMLKVGAVWLVAGAAAMRVFRLGKGKGAGKLRCAIPCRKSRLGSRVIPVGPDVFVLPFALRLLAALFAPPVWTKAAATLRRFRDFCVSASGGPSYVVRVGVRGGRADAHMRRLCRQSGDRWQAQLEPAVWSVSR